MKTWTYSLLIAGTLMYCHEAQSANIRSSCQDAMSSLTAVYSIETWPDGKGGSEQLRSNPHQNAEYMVREAYGPQTVQDKGWPGLWALSVLLIEEALATKRSGSDFKKHAIDTCVATFK